MDGTRIIPPYSERQGLITRLHSTHKMIRSARGLYYWPGMANAVHQWVEACEVCKSFQNMRTKKMGNEMTMDVSRIQPMEAICMDIFYYGADPYLVAIDECSGYKCCWRMRNSSTKSVVQQLEQWFSTAGVPVVIRSDNWPAFAIVSVDGVRRWGLSTPPQHHTNLKAMVVLSVVSDS